MNNDSLISNSSSTFPLDRAFEFCLLRSVSSPRVRDVQEHATLCKLYTTSCQSCGKKRALLQVCSAIGRRRQTVGESRWHKFTASNWWHRQIAGSIARGLRRHSQSRTGPVDRVDGSCGGQKSKAAKKDNAIKMAEHWRIPQWRSGLAYTFRIEEHRLHIRKAGYFGVTHCTAQREISSCQNRYY